MTSLPKPDPRPFAPGIILALLAIGFGFVLGGLFGGAEDSIKDHLLSSADAVVDSVYDGDEQRRDAVVSKSWVYSRTCTQARSVPPRSLRFCCWVCLGLPDGSNVFRRWHSERGL
jgi:hypothetical protein